MGLSSLPSPSEGFLTILIVNTALYVSILKDLLRAILQILRLRSSASPVPPPELETPSPTLTDRFRARSAPVRFGSAVDRKRHSDCRVCLARFEPESVVNRLPCGHLFHKGCLETWLEYQHATCPLCRSHVLYDVDADVYATSASESSSWLWF